jgi:CSLREA domain-containing protein
VNATARRRALRLLVVSGLVSLVGAASLSAPTQSALGATTFVVNKIGDASDLNPGNGTCDSSTNTGKQCTLRAAIQEANDTPGVDTINFNITSTSKTIAPATPLPPIIETVTINGYSQANAGVNTNATGNNAVLKIILDGVNAGADADGLTIQGDDSLVRGLVIQRFDGSGIEITGSRNVVAGNLIGTNPAGTEARKNSAGVSVFGSDNVIGGTTTASRNLISGNDGYGVEIRDAAATGNAVRNNYIGTNKAGTAALGNGDHGVVIVLAANNTIGGTTADARNVISGNGGNGVRQLGEDAGIVITGNYIGTSAAGTAAVGNFYRGITVEDAINPIIGGTLAGARNVISGNRLEGVDVVFTDGGTIQGNLIGTKADGTGDLGNGRKGIYIVAGGVVVGGSGSAANVISGNTDVGVHVNYSNEVAPNQVLGNVIRLNDLSGVFVSDDGATVAGNVIFQNGQDGVQVHAEAQGTRITANQIFGNGQLGIDLLGGTENAAGITANDTDDPDTGANNRQNFPLLTAATRSNANGVTIVAGSLNSNPSTEFRIELFMAVADPSGNGEGQVLLAAQNITTNSGGDKSFSFAGTWPAGTVLTATATSTTAGNTSEFAANRTVVTGP